MAQNEITKVLSNRLEKLTEEKRDIDYTLSDKKQAEQMSIPYPTFVKYKGNKAECPISTIVKMAEYYGVSTDYLLGRVPNTTSDVNLLAVYEDIGLSPKSVENIRFIFQDGWNANILLERDEFKSIVELLNKIKTISVGKRYYNTRIRTEFKEIREALSQKNWKLHSLFFWAIQCIEECHLTGDITVNSDNPYDVKPEQDETGAVAAVNSDKVYDDRIWLSEYQLTEKVFKKLIELIENDTTSDDHLFKNYDYKIGNKLDEKLSYHNGEGEILNRMPPEDIKALEEFIKFFNKHYRKDGEDNG